MELVPIVEYGKVTIFYEKKIRKDYNNKIRAQCLVWNAYIQRHIKEMGSKYPLLLGVQMCMLLADFVFNAVSILMFANSTNTGYVNSAIGHRVDDRVHVDFFFYQNKSIPPRETNEMSSKNIRWDNPTAPIYDTPHILILYIAQKYSAVIHYALYKRAALLMVDPKYHGDSEWLRNEIRKSS
ncbi:hypothetical protein DICVIV_08626 [Dictyocaulus viviparus]|uniref:Transmembrane protein 138 n=1 Tax=Dictyocaulus viviparus TaxID=29172 RepID=A0A0D8XNE8_DICVI|nr:hypothetical protein DICVIV_08626 [Dictyocaulus viviparus]